VSEVIRVIAVASIVVYVVGRQLGGELLRGKRVVLLPGILVVVGLIDLGKIGLHVGMVDVVCLVIGAVIALIVGVGQGRMLRLEQRDGYLWGQMPVKGLWWWAALVGSRLVMTLVAHGFDAKVAASTAPMLMLLGVNRLGQAAIVIRHAMATGIRFAPEKDGKSAFEGTIIRWSAARTDEQGPPQGRSGRPNPTAADTVAPRVSPAQPGRSRPGRSPGAHGPSSHGSHRRVGALASGPQRGCSGSSRAQVGLPVRTVVSGGASAQLPAMRLEPVEGCWVWKPSHLVVSEGGLATYAHGSLCDARKDHCTRSAGRTFSADCRPC
jgi:hypothetical protein